MRAAHGAVAVAMTRRARSKVSRARTPSSWKGRSAGSSPGSSPAWSGRGPGGGRHTLWHDHCRAAPKHLTPTPGSCALGDFLAISLGSFVIQPLKAASESNSRQEKTSTKHRVQTSSACTVMELVSMNCIADQPSKLTITEPFEHQRAVCTHADGVDEARHGATQLAWVFEPAPLAAVQIYRRKHAPRHVGSTAGTGVRSRLPLGQQACRVGLCMCRSGGVPVMGCCRRPGRLTRATALGAHGGDVRAVVSGSGGPGSRPGPVHHAGPGGADRRPGSA